MRIFRILWVRFVLCLLFAASFGACSKDKGNSTRTNDRPEAQKLAGKSTKEVLQTKYKQVLFVCSFWMQRSDIFVKSEKPNDTIAWDLLSDFSNERDFELKAQVLDSDITLKVNVRSVEIHDLTLNNRVVDGLTYKMSNSPYIKMDFSYEVHTGSGSSTSTLTGSQRREVYENISDMTWNEIAHLDSPGNKDNVFRYLECTIQTEAKPEYVDQFTAEK